MEREPSFCWGTPRDITVLPSAFSMPCVPVPGSGGEYGPLSALLPLHHHKLPPLGTQWGPREGQSVSVHLLALHSRSWTATPHSGGTKKGVRGSLAAALLQLWSVAAFSTKACSASERLLSVLPAPRLHQALCSLRGSGVSLSPPALPLIFLHKHSAKACGKKSVSDCRLILWLGLPGILICCAGLHFSFTNLWNIQLVLLTLSVAAFSPTAALLRMKAIIGLF